jgi:hypothetical protein
MYTHVSKCKQRQKKNFFKKQKGLVAWLNQHTHTHTHTHKHTSILEICHAVNKILCYFSGFCDIYDIYHIKFVSCGSFHCYK